MQKNEIIKHQLNAILCDVDNIRKKLEVFKLVIGEKEYNQHFICSNQLFADFKSDINQDTGGYLHHVICSMSCCDCKYKYQLNDQLRQNMNQNKDNYIAELENELYEQKKIFFPIKF